MTKLTAIDFFIEFQGADQPLFCLIVEKYQNGPRWSLVVYLLLLCIRSNSSDLVKLRVRLNVFKLVKLKRPTISNL